MTCQSEGVVVHIDKRLLILDLDEALFHATKSPLSIEHDFMVEDYFAYKRPHVDAFVKYCRENFRLAVWTSATSDYAEIVVHELMGPKCELVFLWSRDQCVTRIDRETYEPIYIKDLKKVKRLGFDLDHVIALDDSPEKLQRNYGNLLRVSPFFGDVDDQELMQVMPYLESLKGVENIRSVEKRGWKKR